MAQTSEEQTGNQLIQGSFNPLMEVKLVNPDDYGEAIEHNGKDIGELLIRGACVTREYFKGAAPDSFMEDDWFKTGDIVTLNEIGEMHIKDRSKDLVKSGGEWISSVDRENFVMVCRMCEGGWM